MEKYWSELNVQLPLKYLSSSYLNKLFLKVSLIQLTFYIESFIHEFLLEVFLIYFHHFPGSNPTQGMWESC